MLPLDVTMRAPALAAMVAVSLASPTTLSLGTGINLGNTLEASCEGCISPAAKEADFIAYAAKGFTTARIPVAWGHADRSLPVAPYTLNASWVARVQEVVGWSLAHGLKTIINSHADTWVDDPTTFDAQLPRFVALWTQISAAFASFPTDMLLFEVFNEPHQINVTQLNRMMGGVYAAIRATPGNEKRWVLINGLAYDGIWWLLQNPDALVIPGGGADPFVAVEVHDYSPFPFCSPPISITTWGTPADVDHVYAMFANVSAWGASKNVPILLGEFSVSEQQPNTTARLLWLETYARATAAANLAGKIIWSDGGWFDIWSPATGTWDEAAVQAIGL
jgi:endoglucanase